MTPEEWRNLLLNRLDDRKVRINRYVDYYEGRHNLSYTTAEFREAFGSLFRDYAENFCSLIPDAVDERLAVNGFRLGEDLKADDDANRIWQDNGLDAESQLCHVEALVKSEAAVIVSPFRSEWPKPNTPLITVEDPLRVIVALDPADKRKRLAALKSWMDDEGFLHATLYLPDNVFKWRSKQKRDDFSLSNWADYVKVVWEQRRGSTDENWPLRNPLGIVPVVPFVNRARLNRTGRSEIEEVMPIQDAVNQLVRNMLLAAELAAFPQRYGINLEPEVDSVTGQPVERYKASIKKLWLAPPPENGEAETKFGQFPPSDLTPYVRGIEQRIQHIATITRTPPHYLLGQSGSFPSGESLKATETGLVAKVRRKQRHFGESWEEVMRLSFLILEDPRGKVTDSEVIWADAESRTEAEHVDALVKMASLGVPHSALWERWGATPQEIARWQVDAMAESLLNQPTPPARVDVAAPDMSAVAEALRTPKRSIRIERDGNTVRLVEDDQPT